ncbi:MAG: hypothetical protein CTY15_06550 [Methylocystis sp.]|nr:MAG: hypothetical protein CTY15_06550 [Methylocystis sp.]
MKLWASKLSVSSKAEAAMALEKLILVLTFLDGVAGALGWAMIGLAAWWVMFRVPLGRRVFRERLSVAAAPEIEGLAGFFLQARAGQVAPEQLRASCEGGGASATQLVGPFTRLALAAAAFAVAVLLMSAASPELWEVTAFVALFLQVALWAHEYGHVVAMRWFGHRQATLMLVPFFGGAAIGARPPETRFEEAVVALMGPAFSGAVILAVMPFAGPGLAFLHTGAELSAPAFFASSGEALRTWAGLAAVAFLAMAIPINLYLAPLGLLDGGRVVEALSKEPLWRALYAAAIFLVLGFALAGQGGAAEFGAAAVFIAVVWAANFFAGQKRDETLPPMSGGERAVIIPVLVATLAIYVVASRSLTPAFIAAVENGMKAAGGGVVVERALPPDQTASP